MTDQRDGLSVAETLADTATDLDRSTHIANSYAPTAPFTDTNGSTYRRASNLTTGQAVLSGASANLLAPALQDRKPTGTKRQHDSGFDAATKNDGPATKRVKATEHEGERDMSHESKAVLPSAKVAEDEASSVAHSEDLSHLATRDGQDSDIKEHDRLDASGTVFSSNTSSTDLHSGLQQESSGQAASKAGSTVGDLVAEILQIIPHTADDGDSCAYLDQLLCALTEAMPRLIAAHAPKQNQIENRPSPPTMLSDSNAMTSHTSLTTQQQTGPQLPRSKPYAFNAAVSGLDLDMEEFGEDFAAKMVTKFEQILEALMDKAKVGPKHGGPPLLSFASPSQMGQYGREKSKEVEQALRAFQLELCNRIAGAIFHGPGSNDGKNAKTSYEAAKACCDRGEIIVFKGIHIQWRDDPRKAKADDETIVPTTFGEFSLKIRWYVTDHVDHEFKFGDPLACHGGNPIHYLPREVRPSYIYIVGENDSDMPHHGRSGRAVVGYGPSRPANCTIHLSATVSYPHTMPWKHETTLTPAGKMTYLKAKLRADRKLLEKREALLQQAEEEQMREEEQRAEEAERAREAELRRMRDEGRRRDEQDRRRREEREREDDRSRQSHADSTAFHNTGGGESWNGMDRFEDRSRRTRSDGRRRGSWYQHARGRGHHKGR